MTNESRSRPLAVVQYSLLDNKLSVFVRQADGALRLPLAEAANDAYALPRWLVRQAGAVEGWRGAQEKCCAGCSQVLQRLLPAYMLSLEEGAGSTG